MVVSFCAGAHFREHIWTSITTSSSESWLWCRAAAVRHEAALSVCSGRLSVVTMAAALPLCYHGAITRTECEDLLGKKSKDGAYLIRDSETIQGAMCLCVCKKKVVYTYRVLKTHTGNYTLMTAGGVEEMYFKTLDELIRHYKRKNQGLAMHLRHSVKRKTAMLIQPQSLPDPPEAQRDQEPLEEDPVYENQPDYVAVLPL